MVTQSFISYRGERIQVTVKSTFQGNDGLMANVEAVQGFPFYSTDAHAQGKTHGSWNCNGYRVRADFVETHAVEEAYQMGKAESADSDMVAELERDLNWVGDGWEAEMTARHADALDEERTMREAAQ